MSFEFNSKLRVSIPKATIKWLQENWQQSFILFLFRPGSSAWCEQSWPTEGKAAQHVASSPNLTRWGCQSPPNDFPAKQTCFDLDVGQKPSFGQWTKPGGWVWGFWVGGKQQRQLKDLSPDGYGWYDVMSRWWLLSNHVMLRWWLL